MPTDLPPGYDPEMHRNHPQRMVAPPKQPQRREPRPLNWPTVALALGLATITAASCLGGLAILYLGQ